MTTYLDVIAIYDGQALMLAERYEASSEQLLSEVFPVIPRGSNGTLALGGRAVTT